MLCFSRDGEVLTAIRSLAGAALTVAVKGRHAPDCYTAFPPSGVIPFHGFTMYGKINIHKFC